MEISKSSVVCCSLVLMAVLVPVLAVPRPGKPSPVIILPGKGGSQIEARVDRQDSRYAGCPDQRDWFRIWLDVWQMLPGQINCWAENLKIQFNESSRMSQNVPGVETRIPGFGETATIEFIDPSWTAWVLGNVGAYAEKFVTEMRKWGLVSGQNLRAAPYDFRYAQTSQSDYFRRLRLLVEETYETNEQDKVVMVSHSMGGLFGMYFLNKQEQEWKDKYIRAFVTLNTPWYGTPMMNHIFASGFTYGIDAVNAVVLRDQQRSYETAALLLPRAGGPYADDHPLIITPHKNYTVNNYDEFFHDVGYTPAIRMLRFINEESDILNETMKHPGVNFVCIHGSDIRTVETVVYKKNEFPDDQPRRVHATMGDGDGTVNLGSLMGCEDIDMGPNDRFRPLFHRYDLINVNHQGIYTHKRVLNRLQKLVFRLNE